MTASRPVMLLAGAAEGLGAGLAATFAAAGYDVVGLSRSDRADGKLSDMMAAHGGRYTPVRCDITRPDHVEAALQPHADQITVAIHSAHRLLIKPFVETTPTEFDEVWRVGCFGAMTVLRVVLPAMLARGSGTVLLTGATASVRGGAKFSAFAAAKFALRGFAQALAREHGPAGIHVAHVLLDGLIDEPQTDDRFGAADAGRMNSDAIASAYLDLVRQHPSAWTHELDLRPFSERF